jgi:hypothetical protein
MALTAFASILQVIEKIVYVNQPENEKEEDPMIQELLDQVEKLRAQLELLEQQAREREELMRLKEESFKVSR